MRLWHIALVGALASLTCQPAFSKTVMLDFSGDLTQGSDQYPIGRPFFGSFRYDDAASPDSDLGPATYPDANGHVSFNAGQGRIDDGDRIVVRLDPESGFFDFVGFGQDTSLSFRLSPRDDPFDLHLPHARDLVGQTGKLRFFYGTDEGLATAEGTFTVAAPVPEPSTWLMMSLGVGFVGLVARKRRRRLRLADETMTGTTAIA